MWKILILPFFMCSVLLADDPQAHLQELKKNFPHGLLTDDFGILNAWDLKINSCIAKPIPFSEDNKASSYSYWQCFEAKSAKMICERGKYDAQEETLMSMLVVSGMRDGDRHEFISRRPIPFRSCQLYQKDWYKLTKNEKYVCVSGSDPSKEKEGMNVLWVWIFGRYKTRKGCDSYFQGECNQTSVCLN